MHSMTRPNMVSVGTIVWLSSELMFFAGLFAMYFSVRATTEGPWPPEATHLNFWFATANTTVLLASSITCQLGVFAAERGNVYALRRWFTLTFFMGLTFVLGQTYEYSSLIREGTSIASNGYGSVFFLTTGFHAMHVTGGLIAFIFLLMRSALGRFTPAQATSAIVVSYYWHFVDVVWVGLYLTIYVIR
ncbi:MAG: heme-copper oxidase subunit III [Pseudonocardiales bacterium]